MSRPYNDRIGGKNETTYQLRHVSSLAAPKRGETDTRTSAALLLYLDLVLLGRFLVAWYRHRDLQTNESSVNNERSRSLDQSNERELAKKILEREIAGASFLFHVLSVKRR